MLLFLQRNRCYLKEQWQGVVNERLSGHAILAFGNPHFLNVKHVAIGYVNTPKYFISADLFFIVNENPSDFTIDIREVIVVSGYSSQRICKKRKIS